MILRNRLLTLSAAVALSVSNAGCSVLSARDNGDVRDAQITKDMAKENTAMLKSIADSLSLLAKTKNAERVSLKSGEEMARTEWMFATTPAGMDIPINVERWTGPLQSVVQMLADYVGYTVFPVGKPKGNERNVTIEANGISIRDALISVATQAGCDARVEPVSSQKIIIIDWDYRIKSGCR